MYIERERESQREREREWDIDLLREFQGAQGRARQPYKSLIKAISGYFGAFFKLFSGYLKGYSEAFLFTLGYFLASFEVWAC